MRDLYIDNCYMLHPSALWEAPFPNTLKLLSMQGTEITNRGMAHIIRRCPELELWNIDGCRHITKNAMKYSQLQRTLQLLIFPRVHSLVYPSDIKERCPHLQFSKTNPNSITFSSTEHQVFPEMT